MEEMKIPVKVASEKELEKADFVICMPLPDPKHFEGNIETECAFCKRGIYHRPYMPKKPLKICLSCAGKLTNES